MNGISLILLEGADDEELEIIKKNYDKPSIERFVAVDKDNFWDYVTETENVYFYKLYKDGSLAGTVQCELSDKILYLAVVVFPEFQNKKIGTDALKYVIDGKTGLEFNEIQVSVDEKNTASLHLFQKVGFTCICQEDELVDLQYIM